MYNLLIKFSALFIFIRVDHPVRTFYSVTLIVLLLIALILLVSHSPLAEALFLYQSAEYLLYLVLAY